MGQTQSAPAPAPAQSAPGPDVASPTTGVDPGGTSPEGAPRDHAPGATPFDPADPDASFRSVVSTGDGEDVLSACALLTRRAPTAVAGITGDHALMEQVVAKLGQDRCPLAMLYLRLPLKWQVYWCGRAGGLNSQGWGGLVANADAQQCAEAVGWQEVCDIIATLSGDPLVLMPPLSADPPKIKFCLDNYAWFTTWIVRESGTDRITQILEAVDRQASAARLHQVLSMLGMWGIYLSTLGNGPTTDPAESQRLWYFMLDTTAPAEGISLFKSRFGIDLTTINTGSWDIDSIKRLWLIADRTPPADLANTLRIQLEGTGTSGEASGWAGDGTGTIGMKWASSQLGATEVGAYTNDADPMRGMNIFDSTLRHEIGHNVGLANGFDQPGGFVYTQFGWQKHASIAGFATVLNTFLGAHPLPLDTVDAGQRETVRAGIITALAGTHVGYTSASYQTAVTAYGNTLTPPIPTLWADIQGSDFITYLLGRTAIGAWNTQSDIGGRSYHVSYGFEGFVSAPSDRYASQVSRYSMRSPEEWFAECYATFYADADRPGQAPGTILEGRDSAAAAAMRTQVDSRHSLAVMTNQTNTVGVGAPAHGPVGDFPAPNLPQGTAYA